MQENRLKYFLMSTCHSPEIKSKVRRYPALLNFLSFQAVHTKRIET